MTAVLVIAADEGRRKRIERAFNGMSVLVAENDADALRLLRYVEIDVVIRDCVGLRRGLPELVTTLRDRKNPPLTMAIGPAEDDGTTDFVIGADFTQRELEGAFAQAAEKRRLLRELAALRQRPAPTPAGSVRSDKPWDGVVLSRVLREFTRAFAAGFDLPRVLEIFLEAVGDLVRPSRVALLLADDLDGTFRVTAHRALPRPIVESVRLSPTGALARWLIEEGRPACPPEIDPDVAQELSLIHCMVAIPVLAHGELMGILTLGQPLVRPGYEPQEIETLFDLATHLATTVRDITLHLELERQKEFSERILAHMSSGVVTIGRDHRIGILNRRGEEILGLDARTTVHQDLRLLPSPLGDMLFATLVSGESVTRSEIQLALGGRWLEVSTYPVRGEDPMPLGAVLVFEDLTAQKELAAQKRQAEQLQLLTRVVARIADEIKNPLVSINTFVELIDDRFDDPDFRKDFSGVVRRDARRMVQVFEKLVGLVSEGELHFTTVDVHLVIDDLVTAIHTGDDTMDRTLEFDVTRDRAAQRVRVDVAQLRKALSYLVRYLTHNSQTEPARVSISVARTTEADGFESVRVLVSSRTACVSTEALSRLFDPVHTVQESLIDVGPAVSQRLVEALGGRLRHRQSKHELAFLVSLPAQS